MVTHFIKLGVYVLGQKKGQITIFILVGIILLIGVVAFFFIRSSSFKDSFDQTSQQLVVEKVSSEFRPVQQYITTCVHDVSKEGLIKIGLHGGYPYTDKLTANKLDPTSKESNALVFWPGDEQQKIAYWWHMDSSEGCVKSGTCSFDSNQPSLMDGSNSIKRNLERYIEKELPSCLNDFNALRQQGFSVTTRNDISADVTIGKDTVYVQVDYAINAERNNKNQDLSFYTTQLDVSLQNMYNLANDITQLESKSAFLETQLIELISVYSGSQKDALLPPFYEPAIQRMGKNRLMWTRTEVKRSLMSILASYVPMFSVLESRNFKFVNSQDNYNTAIFDKMILSLNTSNYLGLDVQFDYKNWWDIYLNIGNSEVLQPENQDLGIIGDVPLVGSLMKQAMPLKYQFGYDVSYPVLVSINDPLAFDGEGFTMKFALESNVQNNAPVFASTKTVTQEGIPPSFYQSIFCNLKNFNSGDVKVTVLDAETQEELEGAGVEYTCVKDSCIMGSTKQQNDGVYLKEGFPVCAGGVLEVSKPGYQTVSVPLSTSLDHDVDVPVIQLHPLQEKKIKVKVFGRVKRGDTWSFNWNPVELRPAESVMLTFKRVKENDFDPEFSTLAYLEGPDAVSNMELVPGEYVVSGQLVFDTTVEGDGIGEVIVPEETRPYGGFLGIGEEEVDLPEVSFGELFPEGMLFLDEDHGGSWELTESALSSTDTITFYLIASPYLEPGLQLDYDDMEEFGKADYYVGVHRLQVEPCYGDDTCG